MGISKELVTREILMSVSRANGAESLVFECAAYQNFLFQIIDDGTPSWAIEIQTSLIAPDAVDAHWKPIAMKQDGTVSLVAAGLYFPIDLSGHITIPRIRWRLNTYATGTPRLFVSCYPRS